MKIPTQKPLSFTLIEMLVVMSLIALLASLLAVSLGGVRERARRLQCMNNLRQIGLALKQYSSDRQDLFPEAGTNDVYMHFRLISNMLQHVGLVFRCPSDLATIPTNSVVNILDANISYTYVRGFKETDPINLPISFDQGVSNTVDGDLLNTYVGKVWSTTSNHKNDGGNILYTGAYVEFKTIFPDVQGKTNEVRVPL